MIRNMRNTKCTASECRYNIKDSCGLNVISASDVIKEQCIPTDNWYIIGSFVLDYAFKQNTAKDIDLVIPEYEMPAQLLEEVINSPLVIQMVWQPAGDLRGFDFYNISLPRISLQGFSNWEVAEELKKDRTIQTLPNIRKVPAFSLFSAIKSMAKYSLEPDKKTLEIWKRSVLNPLAWKKELGWPFLKYVVGDSVVPRWEYIRADYLINKMDRVYQTTADREKQKYLECVKRVLLKMKLNDVAHEALLKYVDAKFEGQDEKIDQFMEEIRAAGFE